MARTEKVRLRARHYSSRLCNPAIITMLLLTIPLEATQTNYRLCFPQVVGVPVLTPGSDPCGNPLIPNQPPKIDGCVTGDPGWTGAFRYVFGNGTAFPKGAVQGINDGTFLYLSFEIFNDVSFDANDLVILTFSPSGNATDDSRIHIYPNTNTQKNGSTAPRLVQYWTDSSTWNIANQPQSSFPNVDSLVASVRNITLAAGDVNWSVEVKLRLADFKLPSSGLFGLYFDVIPIGGGFAPQYYWPSRSSANGSNGIPGNILATPSLVTTNTPVASNWGNGTLRALAGQACAGVTLDWADIKSNNSDDQINAKCASPPPPACNSNIFTATPSNRSIDARDGTTAIAASNVTAIFSIANFGLPSEWTPVPAGTPNGSAGPVTLNQSCTNLPGPNACAPLQTTSWDIRPTDPNLGNYTAHPDQCILVDLDVAFPSTSNCVANPTQCVTFLNKSARRNMWVLTSSEVSKTAEISARGYPLHPGHKTQQEFRLRVLQREERMQPRQPDMGKPTSGNTPTEGPDKVLSRLSWVVEGCRLTGQYIMIEDQRLETCDDVGAFGAIVSHTAKTAVAKWHVDLEGPGLSRVKNTKDVYRLAVPQDGVAMVTVRFAPAEKTFMGAIRWVFIILFGIFIVWLFVWLKKRTTK